MLNPTRIRASTVIHRDRTEVWAVLVDPEVWRALLPKNARIDLLTDRTDQVGSRWRTVNGQGDRAVEVLNEVIELIPFRAQVVRSSWPKATNTVKTTLEPITDGTVVNLETDIHWQPGLGTIVDRLAAAMVGSNTSQRAMEQLKAIAEGRRDR